MVKDLVCGMEVDPADAPAMFDYDGTAYYFCSEECKAAFVQDPERYVGARGTAETMRGTR